MRVRATPSRTARPLVRASAASEPGLLSWTRTTRSLWRTASATASENVGEVSTSTRSELPARAPSSPGTISETSSAVSGRAHGPHTQIRSPHGAPSLSSRLPSSTSSMERRERSVPRARPSVAKRFPQERSRSTASTRMPHDAAATAAHATTDVLPTPPLPEQNVTIGARTPSDVSAGSGATEMRPPSLFCRGSVAGLAPISAGGAGGTPSRSMTRSMPARAARDRRDPEGDLDASTTFSACPSDTIAAARFTSETPHLERPISADLSPWADSARRRRKSSALCENSHSARASIVLIASTMPVRSSSGHSTLHACPITRPPPGQPWLAQRARPRPRPGRR